MGDKHVAYDLTQDIFIKVIQRIASYSNKGTFKSWLYSIAVNHCRDYWKSSAYKQNSQLSELSDSIASPQKSIPYIFERKETREQVKRAIRSLPEYQREAIILKYFQHLKIKEIAEVTDASEATVKSRLKQGLGKIAKLLERGEEHAKKQQ